MRPKAMRPGLRGSVMSDPANPRIVRNEMLVHRNEPPKPFHPQQNFGLSTWAQNYPNLHAYGYDPTFTVMDILDSLAARVKMLDNAFQAIEYDAKEMRELVEVLTTAAEAWEAQQKRSGWFKTLWLILTRRAARNFAEYPK